MLSAKLKPATVKRRNEMTKENGKQLYWIAVNGASAAMSPMPMRMNVKVTPTPQQLLGFDSYEAAKEFQSILLTAPIPTVKRELVALRRRNGAVFITPDNPEPPTRGATMWLDEKPESEHVDPPEPTPQEIERAVAAVREALHEVATERINSLMYEWWSWNSHRSPNLIIDLLTAEEKFELLLHLTPGWVDPGTLEKLLGAINAPKA
jgi:hypothetical protein